MNSSCTSKAHITARRLACFPMAKRGVGKPTQSQGVRKILEFSSELPIFKTMEVQGKIMGQGEGRTKKEAEQCAAAQAIAQAGLDVSGEPRHAIKQSTD